MNDGQRCETCGTIYYGVYCPNNCENKRVDEALINRISVLARKEIALNECVDAMFWFCERVENGEIRSTKTYNRYKELLSKFEKDFNDIAKYIQQRKE